MTMDVLNRAPEGILAVARGHRLPISRQQRLQLRFCFELDAN
jgi:hypothetical protein